MYYINYLIPSLLEVISLIVPTLGKFESVIQLLNSVMLAEGSENIEVIIIDQNIDDRLNNYIHLEFENLNIVYIKSSIKGLSKARNKGLRYANGDIIVFSDDDVVYNADYFLNLLLISEKNPFTDVFIAKLLNIEDDNFYTTSPVPLYLTNGLINYRSCCSVTLNVRKGSIINFNEELGVGSYFGACEDSDFVLQLFRQKATFNYFDELIVRHPRFVKNHKNLMRTRNYSLGFGAFYKIQIKGGGDYQTYFIKSYLMLLFRSFGGMILDPARFKYYYVSFKYKLKGYLEYSDDYL